MPVVMTEDQKVTYNASFKTASGADAAVDGVPQWSSSDPAIMAVSPSIDGLSCDAVAVAVGSAQIQCQADADLGAGVRTITGVDTLDIRAGEAVSVLMAAGAPVSK